MIGWLLVALPIFLNGPPTICTETTTLTTVTGPTEPPGSENSGNEFEKDHQKISCRPGRAIHDLSWTEPTKGYRKFSLTCENVTQSCKEHCNYENSCTVKKYGPNLYVRGIWVMYDRFTDAQKYLLFLCCNASDVKNRTCSGHVQKKEAKWLRPSFPVSFREASSTYLEYGTQGETNNPQISLEICPTYGPSIYPCFMSNMMPNNPPPGQQVLPQYPVVAVVVVPITFDIQINIRPAPPGVSTTTKNPLCCSEGLCGTCGPIYGWYYQFAGYSMAACVTACANDQPTCKSVSWNYGNPVQNFFGCGGSQCCHLYSYGGSQSYTTAPWLFCYYC